MKWQNIKWTKKAGIFYCNLVTTSRPGQQIGQVCMQDTSFSCVPWRYHQRRLEQPARFGESRPNAAHLKTQLFFAISLSLPRFCSTEPGFDVCLIFQFTNIMQYTMNMQPHFRRWSDWLTHVIFINNFDLC